MCLTTVFQTHHSNIQTEIQVVKNKRKHMILTPKRKKRKRKKKEVDEKSNCNYPSILVNTGTNPTVLCCFLSPNQCLILPRSTFLLRNFFADVLLISSPLVGNSKRKENTISGLYCPKKSPKLFIPKISPWLTFSFIEKNEHTFSLWILGSPCPIILLGKGGAAVLLLFIYVRAHQLPRV